ncbi:S41 family peptidase [Alterisphingorhabdus coralli]|uniref:S41 family peptidase n=1 Tax=Alterisphingorhabdus coralli TaxID=3071408 RepID=A0AA97I0N2_9SPHN|nr:S41 family peptidase [Parasphingorhabdus sp. SCSIO 66989]WOE75859.1 S41 family peptidase [Parasphingorhabdus sp. SCSIO 66989]
MWKKGASIVTMAALLASCGSSNNSSTPAPPPIASPAPSPAPAPAPAPTPTPPETCSLRDRQDWAGALIEEAYLFPDLLDLSVDPDDFDTVQGYIDALVAPARAAGRDDFFTFITSIEEENAFFASGTSAGYGFRLALGPDDTLFILDAYEGAPALNAGIDRGAEILAIGTTVNNLRDVPEILETDGIEGLIAALGPAEAGIERVMRFRDADGETVTTITTAEYQLPPISSRFGLQILNDGGRQVGYVNLRTFIDTSDDALRDAFAQFQAEGVTEVILDFRYNGGGLVSTAELLGDLLGANRSPNDIFSITAFNEALSEFNETRFFQSRTQSIAPMRIAVIGTSSTASASELVTNSFLPYLGENIALVGSNTSGKPVGQIGLDREECDDRLRVVAFQSQNADGEGEYFNGLASVMDRTCRADDDIFTALGDPTEASIAQSLSFLRGETCTPIPGASGFDFFGNTATINQPGFFFGGDRNRRQLLVPRNATPAQREVPGTF